MEPVGKQGFLPREEKSVVPTSPLPPDHPAVPSLPHKTPRSQVPSRLRDWSRAIMCPPLGVGLSPVKLIKRSSLELRWPVVQTFAPVSPTSFLFPPPSFHTSLILAKSKEGGGGIGAGRGVVDARHCSIRSSYWAAKRTAHPSPLLALSLSFFFSFFPSCWEFSGFHCCNLTPRWGTVDWNAARTRTFTLLLGQKRQPLVIQEGKKNHRDPAASRLLKTSSECFPPPSPSFLSP